MRGEATKSSDVDLLVILRKAKQPTKFTSQLFRKIRIQTFFVTVSYLQKVFWGRELSNWSDHRLATRLGEMFLLFSRDPAWMMKFKLNVQSSKPTARFLGSLLEQARDYHLNGTKFMTRRKSVLAMIAFRASLECVKAWVFARQTKEMGGSKWELFRLNLLDHRIHQAYVSVFASGNKRLASYLDSSRSLLLELKRNPKLYKELEPIEHEVLLDALEDATEMRNAGRRQEALAILAQIPFVFYLPDFVPPKNLERDGKIGRLIERASGLQAVTADKVQAVSNRTKRILQTLSPEGTSRG